MDIRRQRGARSREAILQAALAVLGEVGSDGFTSRRVAARAGVSPGNLFHHFGSLEELLLEAVVHMLDEALMNRMEGPWSDPRGFLEALGANGQRLMREQPEAIQLSLALFGKLPFHEGLRQKAAEHYRRYVAWLNRELARLDSGRVPADRVHNVALTVLMLMDGMSLHWAVHRDPDELERLWAELVELFTQRLGAAPAPC